MENKQSLGKRILVWAGFLNSASLLTTSTLIAFLLALSGYGILTAMCWAYLVLSGLQVIFATVSSINQRRAKLEIEQSNVRADFFSKRLSIHTFAIVAWVVAVLIGIVPGLLPNVANKIRRRDSHFLVQNFKDHRQEIEKLRLDLLSAHGDILFRKLSGAGFHWDGMSQVYDDGRVDIELFQEPQGFNGQIFVGYTKKGKNPLPYENGGSLPVPSVEPIVNDIEKDQSGSLMEYQALGDGWYIYYWSS